MASVFIMLVVDIFLYLILAWYFDAIVPSSYGTKLPPWFVFMPSYWFPPTEKGALHAAVRAFFCYYYFILDTNNDPNIRLRRPAMESSLSPKR